MAGGRYWYYHCHHRGETCFRADEANKEFECNLQNLQITREVKDLYQRLLVDLRETEADSRDRRVRKLHTS